MSIINLIFFIYIILKIYLFQGNCHMKASNRFNNTINANKNKIKTNKTPIKNKALLGVTFSSKASTKSIHYPNNFLTSQKKSILRNISRSIEQNYCSSERENEEVIISPYIKHKNTGEEGMFGQSFTKIFKLKQSINNSNIDKELNDIVASINHEKQKINERLQFYKRSNNYYRKLCEGYEPVRVDSGINTQLFLDDGLEKQSRDRGIQYQHQQLPKYTGIKLIKIASKVEVQRQLKMKQAYDKLKIMLIEMKINPDQILPQTKDILSQEIDPKQQKIQYKDLSEAQIIKIQKFIIKKIASKIYK